MKVPGGLYGDPYFHYGPGEALTDIGKAGLAGYLGDSISSQAYFDYLNPNDPQKAKRLSKRSAILSGAATAFGAALNAYGEKRDYQDYVSQLARQRANEYYRVPTDQYAYNENLVNPYNNTAYKRGGMIRYQEGGSYDSIDTTDTEYGAMSAQEPLNNQQVVYDSTPEEGPEDSFPQDEDGYDFSSFTPTLGNAPLRFSISGKEVENTLSEIGQHESGGDYGAVNRSGGSAAINATGKYQFVPKYWYKEIANFQGTTGKSMDETMEVFKNSPQIQEAFMRYVTEKYYLPEVKRLLPVAKRYGIDQAGLIKMLHYRGIDDTRRRLQTGNFEVSAREKALYNNPDILSYIK